MNKITDKFIGNDLYITAEEAEFFNKIKMDC